jgi:saccharopine dehydrogenase-like NADP-dependent oxidoreductase
MRIVILGGAGIIGRVIALDLVEDVEEVVIADRDLAGAQRVAREVGKGAIPMKVDVTDEESLHQSLTGAHACINSVNYYFNLEVMRGCIKARVPYLDLGGLFHITRRQLEYHQAFQDEGLTAVLGLGSCPGVANVHAGWLGAMLDTVEYVRIYNGSTQEETGSLVAPYAIQTILDEISKPAMVFRGGKFMEQPPLSEEEYFLFHEPIGWTKTHLSLHSEVATIPLSLAGKGIRECFFKISFFGYAEPALRKLEFLAQLGFAGAEPIKVGEVEVRPRDVLLTLLEKYPQAKEKPISRGYKDVVTVAKGTIAGQEAVLEASTFGGPHPIWGVSGGTVLVAAPPAIVARWLAERTLDRPGVWPPEQAVDPLPFFTMLAKRGFTTQLVQRKTVAMP